MVNQSKADALLPCPFDGHAAELIYVQGNEVWPQSWRVQCGKCGLVRQTFSGANIWQAQSSFTKDQDYKAKSAAIASWNTRTPHSTALPEAKDVERRRCAAIADAMAEAAALRLEGGHDDDAAVQLDTATEIARAIREPGYGFEVAALKDDSFTDPTHG